MSSTAGVDVERELLPEMWDRAKDGDCRAQDWLVQRYLWLPRGIASQRRVPPHFDRDDLLSWAYGGLFDAVLKFKPSANTDGKLHEHFIGYAKMRVNGAILDGMKAPGQSWASREVWRKVKAMNAAEETVSQTLGRPATRAEVAQEMKVEVSDLPVLQLQVHIDVPGGQDGDGPLNAGMDVLADADRTDDLVELAELGHRLALKIAQLSEADRAILQDFYLDGGDANAVAALWDVSPTAANRRRSAALGDLLALLQRS